MGNPRTEFIEAALWHGSLERANELLGTHPELGLSDIHTAAILGDDAAVRRFLEADPTSVNAKSEPYGGDALNYLCMSKYLRLDAARTPTFLRAATALLDAGADPNTGFWTTGENSERETALYGAAGVAHHAAVTRLLVERGADPNDGEAVYHSPETYDNGAMQVLVETGKVTPENLVMMLIRKHDFHDEDGARYLLEHGADPNGSKARGWHPMHHALERDNALTMFELLLSHGADPAVVHEGLTAEARAAREGRRDVLELLERLGIRVELGRIDRMIAACARDDATTIETTVLRDPLVVEEVIAMGGDLLARFAGTGNLAGVRQLLDLGVGVTTPFQGDSYWGHPKGSLPIHVAAWRGHPKVVKLLLERGSPADVRDANGNTPLALAINACVASYWTWRRSPDSVRALLAAGASVKGVPYPSGYAEVDELLAQKGAHAG